MKKTNLGLLSALLIILIVLPYFQMRAHEFINWDDPDYIYHNPMVSAGLSWLGIGWAFITGTAANWHPLTWLSHMLDATLFGPTPAASHIINMIWYMGCVVLAFFLFLRLGASPRAAFLMAAFFGIHPLHVESVAWASERKDVLCAFFFLAATLSYLSYAAKNSSRYYLLTTSLFILALLSKPMAVSWPCVALLLDYWPLRRFQRDVKAIFYEKIPWLSLTLVSSVITIVAQDKSQAIKSLVDFSLTDRLANAVISYVVYIRQTFWPADLTVFYPYPPAVNLFAAAMALCALILISAVFFHQRKIYPYLLTGWFFYLGVLFPVIGVVQIGVQAHADRYMLLPQLGIILGIGLWLDNTLRNHKKRIMAAVTMMIITVTLTVLTYQQVSTWQNNITLFNRNLEITGPNELAHFNLGVAYLEQNELHYSAVHFLAAAQMNPDDATIHNNLGLVYLRQGDIALAEACFRRALSLNPEIAPPHFHMAVIKFNQKLFREAKEHIDQAVRFAPGWMEARELRGKVDAAFAKDSLH